MTRVYVKDNKEQIEIYAEGHAGYGKKGTDIVCAAISALLQSFVIFCEKDRRISISRFQMDDDKGVLRLWIYDPMRVARFPLEMIKDGLDAIEAQYPENLEFMRVKRMPDPLGEI